MVRLDKFLCDCNIGTRSQVKDWIRHGLVCVNGTPVKKPEMKMNEDTDQVTFRGESCVYKKYAYYMLNKPRGVVSATTDNTADTVLSLLKGVKEKDLFPVGRLDKDTTGLLLITNDGDLAHRMLAPKKHVDKTYLTGIKSPLSEEDICHLETGVDIGEKQPTLPAKVQVIDDCQILLTIHEGRFHQVKRMLQAVDNEVCTLKRISFGPLKLDPYLAEGDFRELKPQELEVLQQQKL